jgi:hypothetical protein
VSRNSTAKDAEISGPRLDLIDPEDTPQSQKEKDGRMLMIVFVAMVFVGLGNQIHSSHGSIDRPTPSTQLSAGPCATCCFVDQL